MLSAPNSSFVWIKYFAFLISLGELDKARTLADRALQTISYRCKLAGAGPSLGGCISQRSSSSTRRLSMRARAGVGLGCRPAVHL